MEGNKYGGKFEELRNKAEEVLGDKKESGKELGLEIDELIHELEVHQIELEMQNEDLIRIQIELEDSRRDYLELYDFAPVGYFTLDENGIIKIANLTGSDI
ncbi:MAG TPA: PAS domain-containing sensor histidine kinase, partial [Methanobacterium subterraneum]|nr:PAS domain-containing sensor histidine kinase [Methanobacterium subterraneum]